LKINSKNNNKIFNVWTSFLKIKNGGLKTLKHSKFLHPARFSNKKNLMRMINYNLEMIWCTFWLNLTEGLCEFKLTVSLIYIYIGDASWMWQIITYVHNTWYHLWMKNVECFTAFFFGVCFCIVGLISYMRSLSCHIALYSLSCISSYYSHTFIFTHKMVRVMNQI
jgi:hypothetical protein